MRLEHLEVASFRSIATAILPRVGNFNVLIGQNNSGKSNILSCLSIFFKCVGTKDVVIDEIELGNDLDFHNRNLDVPIEIRVAFSLSDPERDALLGDIMSEVPEMRHAVEGLDHSLLLSIKVQARRASGKLGSLIYIPEIALVHPESPRSRDRSSRIVLELGSEAAAEVQVRKRESKRLRARASALQSFLERFDAEDWARYGRKGPERPDRPAPPLTYYLRDLVGPQSDIVSEVRGLVAQSSSYEHLQASGLSQINELQAEAQSQEDAPLTNKISTITGEVIKVPQYVNKLLERVAELGVLHLRERRKDSASAVKKSGQRKPTVFCG